MQKNLILSLVFVNFAYANDYEFNFDDLEKIQTKQYEYSGYIKLEQKYQILNKSSPKYTTKNKDDMQSYYGEGLLNFKYFKDNIIFNSEIMAYYENIDKEEDHNFSLNQAFVNYNYDVNHQINIGKKTAKWGKGYFFNPVAFIDRRKDPNEPELTKEGFTQINYKYNKVYVKQLQNFALDISYLKTTEDINKDLYPTTSNILALKAYFLYKDIDMDFVYFYSNKDSNQYGFDFSTNLETNFEIHGEFAKNDNNEYSYLLGIKYLTQSELTIISEYFYKNKEQEKDTSFWDNSYFINKFTKKEPFDFLYLNLYYKNSLNLDDKSHQNNLGFIYTGIKNVEIDFSISKLLGDDNSEFGSKLVDRFSWLQIKYNF